MASSSSGIGSSTSPPHYFPTPALDHAFAGIIAGAVATVCMNPLDLVKVQFQVDTNTRRPSPSSSSSSSSNSTSRWQSFARKATGGDVLRDMSEALRIIIRRDGYSGLYRGLSPNVVGNSASWGFYFLWYTMIKEYMAAPSTDGGKNKVLSPGQHLLAASESGAITALMTNPIWVVKTRMFTTTRSGESIIPISTGGGGSASIKGVAAAASASAPAPKKVTLYKGLMQGLGHIYKYEGWRGLYKGAGLALVGVSNGAIQFVCYEELKRWRMGVAKKRRLQEWRGGQEKEENRGGDIQLDNIEYIIMSGVAKLAAISLTYPYQVVRSRIQNHSTVHIYPTIPTCIRLTWQKEGIRGFYKGMAANAIRILPGTCVTFVVYENCSWALRGLAERRLARKSINSSSSRIEQHESITTSS